MACLLMKGKMEENRILETEKIGTLMKMYSVPCIISLLVDALCNIVISRVFVLLLHRGHNVPIVKQIF
jgi:hypothetical protein